MKNLSFLLIAALIFAPANGVAAEAESKFIKAGGAKLHYIEAGEGRPVVMIHGNHSSSNVFKFSIFDRVSQKYRAIAFDLAGYGESSRPKRKMSFDEQAATLYAALKILKIENPILIGHSMGAAIVLRYLLNYPNDVHAAILITPYTTPFQRIRKIYRVSKVPVTGDLYIWSCVKPLQLFKKSTTWTKNAFYPAVPNKEYSKVEVRSALRCSNFQHAAQDMESLRDALRDMNDHYGEIKVPVLIIAGDSDLIAPTAEQAKPLHEKIPGSQLTVLTKAGHLLMFSHPEEVLKAVDEATLTV